MEKCSYRLYCAVSGCFNSSLTHPEITFFKLPGNSERRLEWLQLILRNDLENKPNFAAYRICEKHFYVNDIRQSVNRKLLKKNALPLLMLPSLPSTVPGGSRKEDKQTQTPLPTEIDKCKSENAANESYAQTCLSCNTSRKRELKAELLQCRNKVKMPRIRRFGYRPKKSTNLVVNKSNETMESSLNVSLDHDEQYEISFEPMIETDLKQDSGAEAEQITFEPTLEPHLNPSIKIDPLEDPHTDVDNDSANSPSPSPTPASSSRQSTQIPKIGNRRKRPHESVVSALHRLENTVSNMVNAQQQVVQMHSEDEFHMFALSVAAQLRQLPLHVAIETQNKIQNTLSEARISSIFSNNLEPSQLTLIVKEEDASDD